MALTAWLMQAEPNRKLITEPIKIGPHRLTSDYSRGLQGTPALERATILEVDSETPEEWTTVTHPRLHGNFSETRTQYRQNENDLDRVLLARSFRRLANDKTTFSHHPSLPHHTPPHHDHDHERKSQQPSQLAGQPEGAKATIAGSAPIAPVRTILGGMTATVRCVT
ncbi:uncharacterized protein JN550_011429 [Neoarthrinium moseri]|uniref:uncharacterized protein n=1 Tax=Neoarthrinium moseri TaxID=1658444 RepID=UPI001FDE070C|nr:uncharacterized protein JN550_011429 [Neoarthrinium moseri]KAI1860581.1 hypothetical protein JN550_011429 [Neoarthrinium moseri]